MYSYTDAAVNYLARLHSHNYIDDCPILVLSEYRNFTSEKQKSLTKQAPNGEVNK